MDVAWDNSHSMHTEWCHGMASQWNAVCAWESYICRFLFFSRTPQIFRKDVDHAVKMFNALGKVWQIVYTVFSLKIRHSKYSSPARNRSKYILIADEFPICNIHHIALIIRQTRRAFQYFVTRDGHSLRAAVFVPG